MKKSNTSQIITTIITIFIITFCIGCDQINSSDQNIPDSIEVDEYAEFEETDVVVEKMNTYLINTINQVFIDCGAMSIVTREQLPRDLIIECFYQTDFMYCEKENEANRNKQIHIPEECLTSLTNSHR